MNNIELLISKYITFAILHNKATIDGNSEKTNNAYDELIKILRLLKQQWDYEPEFIKLLEHENQSVRLWAATHCLFIEEKKAIKSLKKIANSDDFSSFTASIVLDEWNSGSLKPPFE